MGREGYILYNQLIEAVPLGLSRTSQLCSIKYHRTKAFFDFKDFFRNKQISTTCLSLTKRNILSIKHAFLRRGHLRNSKPSEALPITIHL